MNEEMITMEETTAVATVEDAEIAELAKVNGVEVSGEVVNVTDDSGINPVVAGAIGLGVTGVVGGLTYLFLKRKKNKKSKNDKKDETKTDSVVSSIYFMPNGGMRTAAKSSDDWVIKLGKMFGRELSKNIVNIFKNITQNNQKKKKRK